MTQTNAQNAQAQNTPTHNRALTQEQQRQAKVVRRWGTLLCFERLFIGLSHSYCRNKRMEIELLLPWEDSAAGEKTNAD